LLLCPGPYPEGVDSTMRELYLGDGEFTTVMGISKNEFVKLPRWKQLNLKKSKGLF